MDASEIAKLANVDLEYFGLRMPKGQRVLRQLAREAVVLR
jgi:hypothetical protein